MIETTVAFLAGFMLSWPALITLLVIGVFCEHYAARGFAVFTALITMVVAYFFFNIPMVTLAIYSVVYVVVGIVWSFYRYRRFVINEVASLKDITSERRIHELGKLHPKNMLNTITAWILIWPFSILENIIGDIIDGIQHLVKNVLHNVYIKIYNSAVEKLK